MIAGNELSYLQQIQGGQQIDEETYGKSNANRDSHGSACLERSLSSTQTSGSSAFNKCSISGSGSGRALKNLLASLNLLEI